MDYHYTDDHDYLDILDQCVRDDYPDHADEARALINTYLRRYDRHRWRVFNGEAADKHQDLTSLGTAHHYVALILHSRDQVDDFPAWYLESGIRTVLHLPFAVIEGGKED